MCTDPLPRWRRARASFQQQHSPDHLLHNHNAQTIFRAGDVPDVMYLIIEGRVRRITDPDQVTAPGDARFATRLLRLLHYTILRITTNIYETIINYSQYRRITEPDQASTPGDAGHSTARN